MTPKVVQCPDRLPLLTVSVPPQLDGSPLIWALRPWDSNRHVHKQDSKLLANCKENLACLSREEIGFPRASNPAVGGDGAAESCRPTLVLGGRAPASCLSWVMWDMGALSRLRSQGGSAAVFAKDSPPLVVKAGATAFIYDSKQKGTWGAQGDGLGEAAVHDKGEGTQLTTPGTPSGQTDVWGQPSARPALHRLPSSVFLRLPRFKAPRESSTSCPPPPILQTRPGHLSCS